MSREICFAVLCPDARRVSVKVTPNTSTLQVLEEACLKKALNPADYDLCHYNKPLDLTLPIRFSNLPNNAQLELSPIKMLRVESSVTVGLQLESGERLLKDFSPSSSLQDVIEQCLNSRAVEPMVVEAVGEPVCVYMRQKLMGDAIKNTTLRSLGLTKGKAIIRLLYRDPEELSEQAHKSQPLKKPISENPSPAFGEQSNKSPDASDCVPIKLPRLKMDPDSPLFHPPSCGEIVKTEDLPYQKLVRTEDNKEHLASLLEKEDSACDKPGLFFPVATDNITSTEDALEPSLEVEEIGDINYIGERYAVLYNLEDVTDVKKADLPDEFFELTIDDARYLMAGYQRERMDLENRPLMIGAQREKNRLQHLRHYSKTIIRVYFPERLVLQALFMVEETVQSVIDFVRNFLEDKDLHFYLYITPPKEKLCAGKTLMEVALVPAANVYFGCEDHRNCYLIDELKSRTSDPRAAATAASNARRESYCNIPSDISMNTTETSSSTENVPEITPNMDSTPQSSRSDLRTTPGTVPKWLKLSKA